MRLCPRVKDTTRESHCQLSFRTPHQVDRRDIIASHRTPGELSHVGDHGLDEFVGTLRPPLPQLLERVAAVIEFRLLICGLGYTIGIQAASLRI